jgi:large subunit ribosomal protein L9
MATHVQIILREDVDNLGEAGELVRVRPGYARNFLIPRGLAAVATRGNIAQVEHEKKLALARAVKLEDEAKSAAGQLSGVSVQVQKQVGEEGKLFGSVTAQDVADALKAKGFEVDRKKIQMPAEAIRSVGTHEVTAKLRGKISATITVEVVPIEG